MGEIRVALDQSCEFLRDAYRCVREARDALDEAVGLLSAASAHHPESLVPPEFTKAGEMFADELELIVGSIELVQRVSGEL
ncbi:hypothetical protein [Saccharothrix sp. Mg75]|uniref:hypothetical protein n=1 Tax=Saccharothrix sp. Mg75 TaxID=3445357 RepID=UPI003EEBAFC5